jgi:hypothetical protein
LAGIEPPVKVTDEVPALTVPPQVVLAPPLTTTPRGNVSVSDAAEATVQGCSGNGEVDIPPAVMVSVRPC